MGLKFPVEPGDVICFPNSSRFPEAVLVLSIKRPRKTTSRDLEQIALVSSRGKIQRMWFYSSEASYGGINTISRAT